MTIKDPFFPRKQSKRNEPCGKNPNAVNASASFAQTELMQFSVGSRIPGGWFTLCVWKLLVASGGGSKGGAVLAPQYHSHLHFTKLSKKMTLLKKNFCGTKMCVCSPKVCFVPALALMQGCLLFVAVNILANRFYFGMEIIP